MCFVYHQDILYLTLLICHGIVKAVINLHHFIDENFTYCSSYYYIIITCAIEANYCPPRTSFGNGGPNLAAKSGPGGTDFGQDQLSHDQYHFMHIHHRTRGPR